LGSTRAKAVRRTLMKLTPVSIIEGQCGGEARCRHSGLDGGGDDVAPGRLRAGDGVPEEVVQQEVCLQRYNKILI
jgi:hypothetical protein